MYLHWCPSRDCPIELSNYLPVCMSVCMSVWILMHIWMGGRKDGGMEGWMVDGRKDGRMDVWMTCLVL